MLDLASFLDQPFTDAYRRIVRTVAQVTEPAVSPYGNVDEQLICGIWFGGHHKRILTTDEGARLEALAPGVWNKEAGPDFLHAEFLLEKKGLIKGDVEVHVVASDWKRHGHDRNPAYCRVALHVCLRNDTPNPFVTNEDGDPIPQLSLEPHLDADLDDLRAAIPQEAHPDQVEAAPGLCRRLMEDHGVSAEWLGQFLDFAGDERVLAKARRFQSALETKPIDQVLYEGLMEGLGYRRNSAPFLHLARLVPLSYLRSRRDAVGEDERSVMCQAALFGVAHLLPDPLAQGADDETRAYVRRLHRHWDAMRDDFARQIMDPKVWQFAGSRPVNYPPRRLAAMARLLAQAADQSLARMALGCFEAGVGTPRARARATIRAVEEMFSDLCDPYWHSRCTFGGKPLASPTKLVGQDRCRTLLVNALIPLVLQCARNHEDAALAERVHAVFAQCPRLAADSVTRHMERHLFREPADARSCVNNARRQQGLHQLYQDWCKRPDENCGRCALVHAVEAMPAATRGR